MAVLLAQSGASAASGSAEVVGFWIFAVLALGSALAVVSMRNIVHGALMLVVNLLAIAGLYLTLESSFLSIVQVLVYAGAIMVLFLFVVMLIGVDRDDALGTTPGKVALAIGGAALLAVALLSVFVGPYTSSASVCGAEVEQVSSDAVRCIGLAEALADEDGGSVAFLGERLFSRFTFPFELAALLLTVATIGAVILARRTDVEPEDPASDEALEDRGDADLVLDVGAPDDRED